jgi:hypothetical protein
MQSLSGGAIGPNQLFGRGHYHFTACCCISFAPVETFTVRHPDLRPFTEYVAA